MQLAPGRPESQSVRRPLESRLQPVHFSFASNAPAEAGTPTVVARSNPPPLGRAASKVEEKRRIPRFFTGVSKRARYTHSPAGAMSIDLSLRRPAPRRR